MLSCSAVTTTTNNNNNIYLKSNIQKSSIDYKKIEYYSKYVYL